MAAVRERRSSSTANFFFSVASWTRKSPEGVVSRRKPSHILDQTDKSPIDPWPASNNAPHFEGTPPWERQFQTLSTASFTGIYCDENGCNSSELLLLPSSSSVPPFDRQLPKGDVRRTTAS